MAPRTPERSAYLVVDGLERAGEVRGNRPLRSDMDIRTRPAPGLPGRAPPLQPHGRNEGQLAGRSDCESGLEMNEVHVAGVSCKREVVTVRKQRIEGAECIVAEVPIARSRIDLETYPRSPADAGHGVA